MLALKNVAPTFVGRVNDIDVIPEEHSFVLREHVFFAETRSAWPNRVANVPLYIIETRDNIVERCPHLRELS